jgi:hypothetical protein
VTIQMQFRVIDGLSVRFAESGDRDDQALPLSPQPEILLAFEAAWTRLAERTHLAAIDLPPGPITWPSRCSPLPTTAAVRSPGNSLGSWPPPSRPGARDWLVLEEYGKHRLRETNF